MFRRPSVGVAEVMWRWCFGFAGITLAVISFLEFLDTLPVSRGDLLFLSSRQPFLISQAAAHIFRGSGARLVEATILLGTGLAILWMLAGSFGRAATLTGVVEYFRDQEEGGDALRKFVRQRNDGYVRSLLGLNFFRVAVALAAAVGCVGALLLPGIGPAKDLTPGTAFLVFLIVILLVWLAWSLVNWFLSLAAVFVVSDGRDTFGAVSAAADLCRRRAGQVSAVGAWFGLAHFGAFFVASCVVVFPLALAGVVPGWFVLSAVVLITLFYFVVVDFLYVGRLAAYAAIAGWPEMPVLTAPPPPVPDQPRGVEPEPPAAVDQAEVILGDVAASSTRHSALSIQPGASVDKDEVITSDLPEASPPDVGE